MDESGQSEISEISEVSQAIESLRQLGADRFDPVRFFYIDVLARRATTQQGSVKRLLDDKLAQALVALKVDFEQTQAEARQAVDHAVVKPSASRLEHTVHGSPYNNMQDVCTVNTPPRRMCASSILSTLAIPLSCACGTSANGATGRWATE